MAFCLSGLSTPSTSLHWTYLSDGATRAYPLPGFVCKAAQKGLMAQNAGENRILVDLMTFEPSHEAQKS